MATLKDIADAVGVSIGTVDRILHKRGRYSEKTAEKVRKAMEELQYTPNIHARGLKKTKQHRFASLIPLEEQDSGYWKLLADGIRRASAELGSYGSTVDLIFFDRYSSDSCSRALQGALDSGVEGLLIAAVRPDDMKRQLQDAGIPYLFVDSDIPELTERCSYIGQDSFQSGYLSGKLMHLLLGRGSYPSRVLMIEPPGSNYHLKQRMAGFRSYMESTAPGVELERMKEDLDEEKSFHSCLESCLENRRSLPDGIFVANSSVYYAASYLKKKGEDYSRIPLIGYDLIPGMESYISEGIIDFILTQQPELQGYQGMITLYEYLVLNKEVQKEVFVPLNIITRENLRTFET
ncbi:MAG: substrate-binding domain-containing protein [Spirochaetales bacterium]|nr:substrate-binding domain-containing protein [Spirochaetales bacterium]